MFFDPAGPFAGTTLDDLPDNRRDCFTVSDLFAAMLLDMRFRPRAVRAVLGARADQLGELLAAVPDDVDLWEATDEQLAPAYELYRALRSGSALAGVGPTTASKLMARKRPRLIPIVDSVIRSALEIKGDSWIDLRAALRAAGVVERIEAMRPSRLSFPVSTLRLLDAALWMRHSRGRAARKARDG
jgi:ABC-type amino acid transport substrate-binding protein